MVSSMISNDPFNPDFWSEIDEVDCPCKGLGWANIKGRLETCQLHYRGQLHPDSRALLLDEPKKLEEEEKRSHLVWKIRQSEIKIIELTTSLLQEQEKVLQYNLELVNKTPTVKLKVITFPPEAIGGPLEE